MSVQLRQWCIVHRFTHLPPELGSTLAGIATGHPKNLEEHFVVCSRAVGKRGELVVTASGTEYELLDPKEDYLALFPDAKSRVLRTLPELPESAP